MSEVNCHRSQPHDRTISTGTFRRITGLGGVFCLTKSLQRIPSCDPYVEAAAIYGILAGLHPIDVTTCLIVNVPADRSNAVGQSESHAGVVGPLARTQTMRTTTAITSHGSETAGAAK